MENRDLQSELGSIRSMMDRSTKFVAVSGLSVIMAGVYALIGVVIAWALTSKGGNSATSNFFNVPDAVTLQSSIIALIIMVLAVATSLWLTVNKAAKRGENIWNASKRGIVSSMLVPLLTGGALMIVYLYRGEVYHLVPVSIIFYGLALVAGSSYTVSLVKYLGYGEIILGLMAALYPDNGIYLWIAGFAFLNIIFGSIMYYRYER